MSRQLENKTVWQNLFNESSRVLLDYMKSDEPSKDEWVKAKLAATTISAVTRHEQTESAKEATAVMVARSISDNPEEFKKYLAVSVPRLCSKNIE